MSKKTYLTIRLAIAITLGVFVGFATSKQMYLMVIPVVLIALFLTYTISKKRTWVVADERDYKIAGEAARMAYTIYTVTAVVMGYMALANSQIQPQMATVAYTLFYSVLGIMLLYSILFKIYSRKNDE